jgi:hypothetical protein
MVEYNRAKALVFQIQQRTEREIPLARWDEWATAIALATCQLEFETRQTDESEPSRRSNEILG